MAAEISFDEAVVNLQGMFDRIDKELIVAMLEANGGHMERTVEQLLEIDSTTAATPAVAAPGPTPTATRASEADTADLIDVDGTGALSAGPPPPPPAVMSHESSTGSHVDPDAAAAVAAALGPDAAAAAMAAEESIYYGDIATDEDVARAAAAGSRGRSAPAATAAPPGMSARASASGAGSRWRHPLPDDFLQIPGRGGGGGAPGTPSGTGGMLEDQLVAQMMADELFLAELQQNPDFAAYLEAEQDYLGSMGADERPSGTGAGGRPRSASEARRQAGGGFAEKLSTLGDDVKRKFNSLVLRFGKKQGGTGGRGPGYATLDGDADDSGEGTSLLASASDGLELRDRGTAGAGRSGGSLEMVEGTPSHVLAGDDDDDDDDDAGLTRRRRGKDD